VCEKEAWAVCSWQQIRAALVFLLILAVLLAYSGAGWAQVEQAGKKDGHDEKKLAVQHWAWASAQALVAAGIGGEELEAAVASEEGQGLDEAISPLEWNAYVAGATGSDPGPGEVGDERYWFYVYTASEDSGTRSVVSRGYAIAGLAKIGNMFGLVPGSGGPLQHLLRFPDWRWLDEKGYAELWESMIALGLVSGYPDGTLRPEKPLTRGEAAVLLKGWLELRDEKGSKN
jgi:hypothetical protein